MVPSQLAVVVVVQPIETRKSQEWVEEEAGEEEEVRVARQREEGPCYGAALGARPPRGPVLAAGEFIFCGIIFTGVIQLSCY